MSQSIASHIEAAGGLPALLLHTDQLHQQMAYVVSYRPARWPGDTGHWAMSAHVASELPDLTRESQVQPLSVELGADLRTAEVGAATTVTKVAS